MSTATETKRPGSRGPGEEPSTWDVTPKWLAVYHVPIAGAPYQENLSLVKPSTRLAEVTEHIRLKFEEIGEVQLMTRPDIFPPMYQVQESDGNCWHFWLSIHLDEAPRQFERIYDFTLPERNP
jgi:hypothetical protein